MFDWRRTKGVGKKRKRKCEKEVQEEGREEENMKRGFKRNKNTNKWRNRWRKRLFQGVYAYNECFSLDYAILMNCCWSRYLIISSSIFIDIEFV